MLKHNVIPNGIKPEMILAVIAAKSVYDSYNYDLVITSICDGIHSKTSLHYVGYAIDLRTRHMKPEDVREVVKDIKAALTTDYDVIQETTHIHIEYQPKRP